MELDISKTKIVSPCGCDNGFSLGREGSQQQVNDMIVQAAAFLVIAAIVCLRFTYDHSNAEKDLTWVILLWLGLTSWSQRRWVFKLCGFSLWAFYFAYLKRQQQQRGQRKEALDSEPEKLEKPPQHDSSLGKFDYNGPKSPMKPVIFPCRTSHTRLFPKVHSFSYSYLFVGIPIGWRGHVGNILSADRENLPQSQRQPQNGWLSVDSADYLARGENSHGLRGKLDTYLESLV